MFPENCAVSPYLKLYPYASVVAISSSVMVFNFAKLGVGD